MLPIVGRARVGSERRPALAEGDAELERSRGAKGTGADSEGEEEEEADTCAPLSPLPAWEKRWAGHGKPVSHRVPLSPNRASSPNRAASPPSPSSRGYSPLRRGGHPGVRNWSSDQNAVSDAGPQNPQGCDQFV